MSTKGSAGARSRARALVVQALYQQQIAGHSAEELLNQFRERPDYLKTDQTYFAATIDAICADQVSLQARIDAFADRPVAQLDPVEMAILLLGMHELEHRDDIPYRVVINEAVNLAKMFGAVDGHKYINAILDRAAQELRAPDASG
jgi:N utilization substance protein B